MVAPQINGWTDALDNRPGFDLEKSKALLAEAGYPDGFEVTMDCPNDRYVNDERIYQAVAFMLAKVDVKVNVFAQTKSKYLGKVLAQNDYDTSFYLLAGPLHPAVRALSLAGEPSTSPSLDTLIRVGNDFLLSGSWWITIFPGAALALLVLAVNLLRRLVARRLEPEIALRG